MGEELVVGVDGAKWAFYAAIMCGSWDKFDIVYFERDTIGAFIHGLKALGYKRVTLVIEPTGTYCDVLIEQARAQGFEVVRIAGSVVNKAGTFFDNVPSLHDGKAAYLLARLHLCGVGTSWLPRSQAERDLRALADMDSVLGSLSQQLVGPLEAHLARHWPELTCYLELGSATLLKLLSRYPSPRAVVAHKEEAAELMRRCGGRWLKGEKIAAIIASAHTTLGVATAKQEEALLTLCAQTADDLRKRCLEIKGVIERSAVEDERTAPLTGFVGKRSAVFFVAYLGNLASYATGSALEKAMGLNLCERSTGLTRQDKQATPRGLHISKRGPNRVRTMLYFLAMRMINPTGAAYCPVATAWYGERLRLC